MQKKQNLSAPKRGMNRTSHPAQLENTEYSFCMDCNTENETGEALNITNEPSNYFAVDFPQGFKVVGYEKHPTKEITYYFLTNPTTGYSSVGYVEHNIGNLTFISDTEEICEDCDYYSVMPTPLEDQVQVPYEQYTEFFNDNCNKDLNFSINHPIKHIEIKVDKLGTNIYFVDGYNPDRWFNADNIDYYKTEGEIICGVDNTQPVCVNVSKMLQQPNYNLPILTPEVLQIGGNLRMGTYEVITSYSDAAGNEISQYTGLTQPITIFDENNRVLDQTELDSFTNFAIRVDVSNLDTNFKYYKVVVIERVAVNQAESYFVQGIYPTSDNTILITSTQTGSENIGGITQRINYDRVMSQKVFYEHSRIIEAANNSLFKGGLTGKKFPNLQPIVNLIGGFVKWQTGVAKEGLYKDPIANSRYKGYMREEVEPFGIRFFNKDGSEYPLMPLIPRPAKASELTTISPSDLNLQSVLTSNTNCSTTERNKRWQLFNTATVEGICTNFSQSETTEEEQQSCTQLNVAEIENGTISVPVSEGIANIKDYINANLEDVINPSSDKYMPEIASYLTATYPDNNCSVNFEATCTDIQLESTQVMVQQVVNESYSQQYNENASNYPATLPPSVCQPFRTSGGEYLTDDTFQTNYGLTTVYLRQGDFFNENCVNAISVTTAPTQGIYHRYFGGLTVEDLLIGKTIATTNDNFFSELHRGALWFKINKNGRDKILFEITQNSDCTVTDEIPEINQLRYSFFSACEEEEPFESTIISTNSGIKTVVDVSTYPDTFYVVVDPPIVETSNEKFRTAPPCGCYSLVARDLAVTGQQVSFDSMVFQKEETYSASCTYEVPSINDCYPVPYEYGDFSYWESTDIYPDNGELYNSSDIVIETTDLATLTQQQRNEFETYYSTGISGTAYNLKADTDFRCQPIRQYKFPSNIVSPFMGTIDNAPFSESLIFPMGIMIDNEVVNAFLNIAVKNNILTQKQRDNIAGYEVVKGDNSLQKSIVANTVGFDMYKYTEKGKEVLYPNYPLNDLGKDMLHMQGGSSIQHPYDGEENYNFSLISPDLSLNKPTLPTELIVSGYQFGNSRGYFQDVDNHPKWVLMTDRAKTVASILAGFEYAFEIAIKLADYTVRAGEQWFMGPGVFTGQTNGVLAGGNNMTASTLAGAIAIGALEATTGITRIGQYRLQWLETIRNLGQQRNYSSYYVCEGHHNQFSPNTISRSMVRGIASSKYLKSGRYKFKNEIDGSDLRINNYDREYSTFISTGEDFPITYPTDYSQYDNNNLSDSTGSRTILSQNGGEQGEETLRNSAVPYITLRNYIPNQWGTINSIKWLTTSYRRMLSEGTRCEPIFGGTVYISRDVQKRKHPIFRTTAFGQANMTPFSYNNYKNVGTPRFYVDYEEGGSTDFGSLFFPDIDSDYNLDQRTDDGFYIRSRSKFYLYYYGFVSYLVESEINTNYRYGRRALKDQYYPDIQGDMVEFTQEKNLSIKEPPTYFYNSVYSRQVTQTPLSMLPVTYSKELYDRINDAENGVMYSLTDNSQSELTDPWLVFPPLNWKEYDNKYGKLISIESLESETLLLRFENGEILLNAVDTLVSQSNTITTELGQGGVFAKRGIESIKTDLGSGGTQNTDYLRTKYGNFSVDAKRGTIFQRSGQQTSPISDIVGQRESGLKNWFRQHLPFKILRDFPNVDIDNKYKGIGVSMGFDNKSDRVFITKRDYKIINKDCLQYDEELGFVVNETQCSQVEPIIECPVGYTYNSDTNKCEKEIITQVCPDGYNYNPTTGFCETEGSSTQICENGYTYNQELGICVLSETIPATETEQEVCESDIVFIFKNGSDAYPDKQRVLDFFTTFCSENADQIDAGIMRVGVVYCSQNSTIQGGAPTLYGGIYPSGNASVLLPNLVEAGLNILIPEYYKYSDAAVKAAQCVYDAPQARSSAEKRIISLLSPSKKMVTEVMTPWATPTTYMGCSAIDTTDPGGYPLTAIPYWQAVEPIRAMVNFKECMLTDNNTIFNCIYFGATTGDEGTLFTQFFNDIASPDTAVNAISGNITTIAQNFVGKLRGEICSEQTIYTCPEGCELQGEECNCEDSVVAPPCGDNCTVIMQPDGNAICICPSEEIPNQCPDCDVEGNYGACAEGYIFDEDLQKCVRLLEPCPPSQGYFAGGVFTQPPSRLYNSVNPVIDIFTGGVLRLFRCRVGVNEGKILVAGSFNSTSEGIKNRLIRLNVNGTVDNTLDIGSGFNNQILSVDEQPDGKLIIVGAFTTYKGQSDNNGIIRISPDGTKDTTFNNSIGFQAEPHVVKVVENGKILVGANNGLYKGQQVKGLIKLLPDGNIDIDFDGGNRFRSFVFNDSNGGINGITNWNGFVWTIEVDSVGRYLVGGNFNEYNGVLSRRIVRIQTNGTLDTTFNVGQGFLHQGAIGSLDCQVFKIQMQGNKILAAGNFYTYKGQPVSGIVRLNQNGSLDNSFNNDKILSGGLLGEPFIWDFDITVGGQILMGGTYTEYDGNGVGYITKTDVNGFAIEFPNPNINATVFTVLNEPNCDVCPSEDCITQILENGDLQCQCEPTLSDDAVCTCIDQIDPTITDVLTPVSYDNPAYFKDVSWTVAYKPTTGSWVSYYSFKPDYYVEFGDYFQAGSNTDGTLWTHPLKNYSFGVFFGVRQPWIVEFPVINENVNKILNSVTVNSEAKRWQNDWDYNQHKEMGFNRAVVYNNTRNSGLIELNQQQSLSDVRNYPQTSQNSQAILYTSENGTHNFNYFYNRVKNQNNGVPIWRWDDNMIDKTLNPQAISFKGKKLLERISGEYFLIRLINDMESRLGVVIKNTINTENIQP